MSRQITDERLSGMAARLRLAYMRDHLAEMMKDASDAGMTPRETLEYMLSREVEQRESNRIRISTMAAHFPRPCTLESFDFSAQPTLDPGIIRDLARMEWIDAGGNVLFLGPPGVGKTHLAIALGRLAVQKGDSVLFISASRLMSGLEKACKEGALLEKLATLYKPRLLIIDELGYLPFPDQAASLFFQLVSRRYEHKSILITCNRSLNDWGRIFGDSTVATAILDRLLHHCTPVTIIGDSYRIKEAKKKKFLEKIEN